MIQQFGVFHRHKKDKESTTAIDVYALLMSKWMQWKNTLGSILDKNGTMALVIRNTRYNNIKYNDTLHKKGYL
jgi:hypothetical protein